MSIIDDVKIKQFRDGEEPVVEKPINKGGYINPLKKGTAGFGLYDLWKKKYEPKRED